MWIFDIGVQYALIRRCNFLRSCYTFVMVAFTFKALLRWESENDAPFIGENYFFSWWFRRKQRSLNVALYLDNWFERHYQGWTQRSGSIFLRITYSLLLQGVLENWFSLSSNGLRMRNNRLFSRAAAFYSPTPLYQLTCAGIGACFSCRIDWSTFPQPEPFPAPHSWA